MSSMSSMSSTNSLDNSPAAAGQRRTFSSTTRPRDDLPPICQYTDAVRAAEVDVVVPSPTSPRTRLDTGPSAPAADPVAVDPVAADPVAAADAALALWARHWARDAEPYKDTPAAKLRALANSAADYTWRAQHTWQRANRAVENRSIGFPRFRAIMHTARETSLPWARAIEQIAARLGRELAATYEPLVALDTQLQREAGPPWWMIWRHRTAEQRRVHAAYNGHLQAAMQAAHARHAQLAQDFAAIRARLDNALMWLTRQSDEEVLLQA